MAKRYFVKYDEARHDLLIGSSSTFVMSTSFHAGLNLSRYAGHARKSDAVEWAAKVNAAAGKPIAHYAGAFDV